MKWVLTDENGIVLACANRGPVPVGGVEVETDFDIGNLARSRLVGEVPVLRPDGPEIVSDGTTHTVMDCQVGTVVEVYDVTGGEFNSTFTVAIEGDDVELTISEAGVYVIEVEPPLPAMPVSLRVTV